MASAMMTTNMDISMEIHSSSEACGGDRKTERCASNTCAGSAGNKQQMNPHMMQAPPLACWDENTCEIQTSPSSPSHTGMMCSPSLPLPQPTHRHDVDTEAAVHLEDL